MGQEQAQQSHRLVIKNLVKLWQCHIKPGQCCLQSQIGTQG